MNSLYVVLVDWEHVGVSMYFDYPNQFKDFTTKLLLEVEDKSDVYSENSNLMEMIKNQNMKLAEFTKRILMRLLLRRMSGLKN